MEHLFYSLLRFILKPVFLLSYGRRLPNFTEDFAGKPAFMISRLPGNEGKWIGQRRRQAILGNTLPWDRYFNCQLKVRPQTLAEIECFLYNCRYLSDLVTRKQTDFWEPPDVFEERKTGDCEDHAIWAWRHLHELGYRSRLVLGNANGYHAWVHIFRNKRVYLFEPTQKHNWYPNPRSYTPHWSVEYRNGATCAFYRHKRRKKHGKAITHSRNMTRQQKAKVAEVM